MTGFREKKIEFKALDCVSIQISEGDRIGLLGRNGAGKTTFLQTLAGVYHQTDGSLSINAPTTSFFQVGVGTDPDASGFDNIHLLMASRGIPKNRFDEVLQDVSDFTELGDALYRPLRTYSAGMRLRIAFAVATFEANGALLMDEVIGVGDNSFRIKARERLRAMLDDAATLVLASHSSEFLMNFCQRGIVFEKGRIVFDGPIRESIAFHDKGYNT